LENVSYFLKPSPAPKKIVPKPVRDYDSFQSLQGDPQVFFSFLKMPIVFQVGDLLAFKKLELTNWVPEVVLKVRGLLYSLKFQEATVLEYNKSTGVVRMRLSEAFVPKKPQSVGEEGEQESEEEEEDIDIIETNLAEIFEIKVIERGAK
jgi:hypothetical protein